MTAHGRRASNLHRPAGPATRRQASCGVALGLLATFALLLSGCGPADPATSASAGSPPTSAVQDFTAAQTLQSNSQCARAIPLYLRAILKNPIYVNAYSSLAVCYQIVGSYNAAIVEFDKAIAIDPTNYGLYIGRAGAEAVNGSTGTATADDSYALRLAPAQAPAYSSIAGSFASYADFADALKAMDKAISLVPDNVLLYEQRAGYYLQAQDARHAYADYYQVLSIAPNMSARVTIYASLASAYDQQQDFTSASRAIATAIRLAPRNASLYIQSGTIHKDAGEYTAALALYDQALRLARNGPNGPNGPYAAIAHEDKGDVYAGLNQTAKAVDEYRRAARLTKDPGILARIKSKITSAQSPQ